MKIQDARAVVTGGASGLGNAVARHIVAAGGQVTLLDVQEGPGQKAAAELGPRARFQRCDVTSEADVEAAMQGAAFEGQIGQAAYSTTKACVMGMTLPLAREFASFGIRVNSIAPGIFQTAMVGGMKPEVQASLEAQVPFPSRLARISHR